MFDVFYIGKKPDLFPHERSAESIQHAREQSGTRYCWIINYLSDYTGFDFLWEPPPWQAHQRHSWPSQHQPDSETYLVPKQGYEDTNYHTNGIIKRLPDLTQWIIPDNIDVNSFDFSWHPDPQELDYEHHFGTQWQVAGGPIYPGTAGIKIEHVQSARALPNKNNWHIPDWIDAESIDYSWHPDPLEPPCNYMFETKWHWDRVGGPEYRMPGTMDIKYSKQIVASTKSDRSLWHIPPWIDPASIDYTWVPNPTEPPYTYEFPVEWGWDAIGGPEYRVPGAVDRKYVNDFMSRTLPDPTNFSLNDDLAQDDPVFRWRPNPTESPYIYVFGNQWHQAEVRESARYTVPGATELKYINEVRATRLPDRDKFVRLYDCEFDCSWEPDPGSPPYIYVFGNQYYPAEVMPTVEYHMPGATERKFMDIPAQLNPCPDGPWQILRECEWDYTWRPEPGTPAYIYVFGNQWWSAEKMPTVEYHMPGATERKYMPGPAAQLPVNMTHWHIPAGVDVRDMDFSWVPDPGEPPYIYQFATQHQKTGGPQYRVEGATEIKYLDMMRAEVSTEAVPIIEIDHMDGNAGQIPNTIKRVRYFDNYRDTLIRIAKSLAGEHEHVWICSSVCDYTDFDFSWHPETWQSTMLHVFASGKEKFGDTFYMHVPTFADRAEKKALLEWYSVNFVPRISVPRRPMPVIQHSDDTHVDQVKTASWAGPAAVFSNTDREFEQPIINLWRAETKNIVPVGAGASVVAVPKIAVPDVKTQLYDYPNIDKKSHRWQRVDPPLDVVFISNSEYGAEHHWEILRWNVGKEPADRLHRVDNVKGRVAAYQAAARASKTDWFFVVFAKLQVNGDFDWSWQPDRLQQAKHYIFHAYNPVNHLTYGHQAMIAYNRRLVLENTGQGLDFTLDQDHEVVPIVSGTAYYDNDPWTCWRTAFREALKLRHSLPDVENEYRLDQWLSVGDGVNGHWSCRGAQDAVEYYKKVSGEFAELKKSYEWDWLASYALMLHPELFTQSKT